MCTHQVKTWNLSVCIHIVSLDSLGRAIELDFRTKPTVLTELKRVMYVYDLINFGLNTVSSTCSKSAAAERFAITARQC